MKRVNIMSNCSTKYNTNINTPSITEYMIDDPFEVKISRELLDQVYSNCALNYKYPEFYSFLDTYDEQVFNI